MGIIRFTSEQLNDESTGIEVHPSGKGSIYLASIVLLMVLFGLAMLYSTSAGALGVKLFVKQLAWAVLGIFCAAAIYSVGYKKLLEYSIYFLVATAILLIIARLNRSINGSHRWIRVGSFSIQPSEFAKLALIMFIAQFCVVNQKALNKIKEGIIPLVCVCGMTTGLVLLGKDLGTTVLILGTCFFMLFVAGLRMRYLAPAVMLGIPSIIFFLKKFDPERWSRIITFLDPEVYCRDDGYQLWMSLLALGSGSWTGLGFTQSRMKGMYLPEANTDFILSIAGEELGYLAMIAVVLAYLIFLVVAVAISIRAADRQGMLLGFGIATMITLQGAINMGVISGALPTKGIPAPFISYGGSNLLVSLCCAGFLLSIAAGRKPLDYENNREPFRPGSISLKGGQIG